MAQGRNKIDFESINNEIQILKEAIKKFSRGGMLSSKDFFELRVHEKEKMNYLKEHERAEWNKPVNCTHLARQKRV